MTLVVPNSAELIMLEYILNKSTPEDLTIHLFSNDITPSETDTIVDYTEVTGGGYASINLTAASWSISSGTPTNATYPQVSWIFTGAVGNVYGYYISRQSSSDLFWSERFTNGPFNVTGSGVTINVNPRISLE